MVSNTRNLEPRNYSDIPKLSRGYSDISTLSRIFSDIPALSRSYSHILTLSRSYSDISALSRSYSDIPTLSLLVRRGDVYYLLLTLYSLSHQRNEKTTPTKVGVRRELYIISDDGEEGESGEGGACRTVDDRTHGKQVHLQMFLS